MKAIPRRLQGTVKLALFSCWLRYAKISADKAVCYHEATRYWNSIECTDNGMLCGFGELSEADISSSRQFLASICDIRPDLARETVLDCGAGIGRVTKNLLSLQFQQVDLVDQCERFASKARQLRTTNFKIRNVYTSGLQDFTFIQLYDCVWVQWVLCQLSDSDAANFLRRAKNSLTKGGCIIVKENISEVCVIDGEDNSLIRSQTDHLRIFQEAGLKIVREKAMQDWPIELYAVRIYALV